jgi:proteasome lid subunit RPN8/RPN11
MEVQSFAATLPAAASRPQRPVHLRLSAGLLDATQYALRAGSADVRESTALWAGRPENGSTVLISHLLLPIFQSRRNYLTIPKEERVAVANYLRAEGLLAFADLHTHPHKAFLSDADRARPFNERDGFYAVVIPHFAAGPPANGWRFYEARWGDWIEVDPIERVDGWPV